MGFLQNNENFLFDVTVSYLSKLLYLVKLKDQNLWRPVEHSLKDLEKTKKKTEPGEWGRPQQRGWVWEHL